MAIVMAVVHAEIPVEEGVLVLGDDNFDEAVAAHSMMLVEFYAPWCGHCKKLAPEWAKAAGVLADSPVKLAKVDATEHEGLAQEYGIRGFPTIKFIKNGKSSDYSGGRTSSEIVSWVNKKSGPAAATIATEDDLTKFQEAHEAFALGVFSSVDSEAAKKFMALADADEINTYAITTAAAVKSKLAVDTDAVVVLKSFDDLRADLSVSDGFKEEEVQAFISGNTIPLVQTFSAESSKKIFSSPIQTHVLFFTDKSADHHEPTIAAYTAAAAEFKGKLLFVNVPASETKVMDYFDIKASDLPTMVLADLGSESGMKKYFYTGASEKSAIAAFASSFLAGELTPTLKSEAVEDSDATGDVVVLRGTSFKEHVIENDNDVLVEFYAPWCGHCKKLAPIWDQLGADMKSYDKITIAKMDATANEIDVPGVAVRGFPTIYYFKGDDKSNPVKYEGGRELEDFKNFLKAESTNHKDEL